MIAHLRHLWLLALACCIQPSFANEQELNFIHYNTDNSALPHDICYRMMQDKKGYLWVGTDNGLIRFDGLDMKIFRKEFKTPYIIATSQYGNTFMISTWKGGVYKLTGDSVIPVQSPDSLSILNTNKILTFGSIVALYAFSTVAFYLYRDKQNTLIPADFFLRLKDGSIKKIGKDLHTQQGINKGLKCFILRDRLFAYNRQGIFCLNRNIFEPVSRMGFDEICQNQDYIYGTYGGVIYKLSQDFQVLHVYPFDKGIDPGQQGVYRFAALPSGNLVLLSDAIEKLSGKKKIKCLFFNTGTGHITDLSRALQLKVFVSDILADKDNGFWISTYGQGLYHVFEPKYRRYADFENIVVTDVLEDKGKRLYIGTQSGLYELSNQEHQVPELIHPDYSADRLYRNSHNDIGVQSKTMPYGLTITSNHRIHKCANDYFKSTAHYSIKETFGLAATVLDKQTGELVAHALTHVTSPTDFGEDGSGRVWMASNQGLYYWEGGNASPMLCSHPILSKAMINKLLPDSLKGIWVGSSAGLFYLRDNKTKGYNETDGLSNVHINALLLHGDKLWIGTQNGLNILNLKSGNISVYKKHNGLIANDVTALAGFSAHEIAVGSSKGVTIIDAEQVDIYPQATHLLLEQVCVNERVTGTPVTATYDSRISISYNVISFIYPELTRFQYRLSERDQWIETKNKSIILTSLASGTYNVQIRAKKYNGAWSKIVSLPLKIERPWWKTIFFYTAVIGLIIAGTYFVLQARNKRANRETMLQQQFSELRLKALQARLNPHFVSNALSTIQFFNLTQDQEATHDYLTRFANMTRLLLESSHNRFILLKDELQMLTYYLGLEKIRFKDRFVYDIQVAPEVDTEEEMIPGVLLQPFVENSINHGIAYLPQSIQGHICINIQKQHGRLTITIADNGIGRQKAGAIQRKTGKLYRSRSSEIIESLKQAMNNLPGCYISTTVEDRYDHNGIASGTRIIINCYINTKQLKTYESTNY